MPLFKRYIGIDYSGAQTPDASLKGLRVYEADRDHSPVEVLPPPSPRKYWTRSEVAEWLGDRLEDGVTTLVGIDHGFLFPCVILKYTTLSLTGMCFLRISKSIGRRMGK